MQDWRNIVGGFIGVIRVSVGFSSSSMMSHVVKRVINQGAGFSCGTLQGACMCPPLA